MALSVIFIAILALSTGLAAGKNTERNELEGAIQDIFKEFFGLSPPEMHHLTPPPRHMLNLFRKYTTEHAGKEKDSDNPNTVRNIFPMKGPASLSDVVLFNVSSVRASEDLQLAQLHLNRRRLHQRHPHPPPSRRHSRLLPPPHRLRLYQVTGTRLTSIGSVPLQPATRRGWHSVDITDQLNELLLHPRLAGSLLGVRFEAPKGKSLTPKHFLRDNPGSPSAFLMLYSEDDPNSVEEGEDHEEEAGKRVSRPHTHDLAMKIQKVSGGGKQWSSEMSNDLQYVFPGAASSSNLILNKVNASSLANKHASHLNRVDSDGKIVLTKHMARQLPPSERQRRSLESGLSPIDEMEDANDAARLADADADADAKTRQSRMIIRGRNKIPEPTRRPTVEPIAEQCGVQSLTVDFADIGWDKWIYMPKSFEARFCAGSCLFPNALGQLNNHAYIQSFLRSYLGHNELPPLCCSPNKLKSVKFLYNDNGSVVIREFPDMNVESCSCR